MLRRDDIRNSVDLTSSISHGRFSLQIPCVSGLVGVWQGLARPPAHRQGPPQRQVCGMMEIVILT
eukprot:2824726-Rhodomonas_salina.2